MPHHVPTKTQQLCRRPRSQACRQTLQFSGVVPLQAGAFRQPTRDQQRTVASCAAPLDDGPPGQPSGAFLGATPGEGAANEAVSNSEPVQGGQAVGRGRVVDAAKASGSWGQITPQTPATAARPRRSDQLAVTKWSDRIKDTEAALESLEQAAKRKRGRGREPLQGVPVVPEWQSLRDGLGARAERDSRSDSEDFGSLTDEEDDEFYDEGDGGEDYMSEGDEQQAQPAVEPRPDFTTMQEVRAQPRLCPVPAGCISCVPSPLEALSPMPLVFGVILEWCCCCCCDCMHFFT